LTINTSTVADMSCFVTLSVDHVAYCGAVAVNVSNVCSIREACEKARKQMSDSCHHHRAEFLPVEWRSKLTLDGGRLNYTASVDLQFHI